MPIKVTLHREFILPSYWIGENEVKDFKTIGEWAEFFEEDTYSFLDDAGGLINIIQKVEVIDGTR